MAAALNDSEGIPSNLTLEGQDAKMEDDDEAMDDESSESDDECDVDDDVDTEEGVQELQQQLAASPMSYELHIQYIAILRKKGHLEKLREAREAMNALYPLTSDLWLEWTKDEARLVNGPEDVDKVVSLYERGVQEYLSVPLWLSYLEFVMETDSEVSSMAEKGLVRIRALFERALAAAGIHMVDGHKVWEAYRMLEEAILLLVPDDQQQVRAKQIERVRSLYRRQLSVPLMSNASALEEYRGWEQRLSGDEAGVSDEGSQLSANVEASYKKAASLCDARQELEATVASRNPADSELLQQYLNYIELEKATGEPARVQIIYERALPVFPVTSDLWLQYSAYLDTNLKVPSVIENVYARAVRNCPWVGALWSKYLLALERARAPESKLSSVFETGVTGGLQTPNEMLELVLTRADGVRRRIAATAHDGDIVGDVQILLETFRRGDELLATHFPEYVDPAMQLHGYWADIQAHIKHDLAAARAVWEALLKTRGWMLEAWQRYIAMEVSLGNLREARALYRRCYSRRFEGMGTEIICGEWNRFEREKGALDDLDLCLLKITPRLAEVRMMELQQESRNSSVQPVPAAPEPAARGPKAPAKHQNAGQVKRKRGLGYGEKSMEAPAVEKRQKAWQPPASGQREASQVESSTAVAEAGGGEGKGGDAPQQIPSGPEPEVAAEGHRTVYTDECTAFVSNLDLQMTEAELREVFAECGELKGVRLAHHKVTGQFRGFAYVEFGSDSSLQEALKKNREFVKGRQISVKKSDPTSARPAGRPVGGSMPRFPRGGRGRGQQGVGPGTRGGRGRGGDEGALGSEHQPSPSARRGVHLELKGSNTFARPRNVGRPPVARGRGKMLGTAGNHEGPRDEAPKSNEDFRAMLLKK